MLWYTFSLAVSPYDPDSRFSMNSLSRLEEGAGIKIVTSLAEIPAQLAAVLGVRLMAGEKQQVEVVIGKWESGQSQHPITWRSLLDILKELNLKDLRQDIDDYMHGELCCYKSVYGLRRKGAAGAAMHLNIIEGRRGGGVGRPTLK